MVHIQHQLCKMGKFIIEDNLKQHIERRIYVAKLYVMRMISFFPLNL